MLGLRDLARSSSRISMANIGGGVLAAAANILAARHLGPEPLGIAGLVQLWLLYAGFAKPGFIQAAYRETLSLHGQGREAEARRVQNVALTSELVLLPLPAALIAAGALLYDRPELRIGMLIAAATFTASALYQLIDALQWAHHRFSLIARSTLIQRVSQAAFMVAGAYTLGVYGILLAPLGATVTSILYYRFRTAAIPFTPTFDLPESKRLAAVGLPLVVNGLLYWGFRTSDRALVAALLPFESLGHFTFAMMFITQACQVISDFLNVLQAKIFSELGRLGAVRPLASQIQRISLAIVLGAGIAAGLAQALIGPAVAAFVPKFAAGVPAFEVLALNLLCTTAPLLAFTVLLSSTVDRSQACNILQAAGLAANVALGYVLARRGYGLPGIAWSSALSQLAVAAGAQAVLHPFLFADADWREPARFYGWGAALIALAFGLQLAFSSQASAAVRLSATLFAWSAAGGLFYRAWWRPSAPTASAAPC